MVGKWWDRKVYEKVSIYRIKEIGYRIDMCVLLDFDMFI